MNVITDMTSAEPRLHVELNGLKVHVYNRTDVYSGLEKLFGLDSSHSTPPEESSDGKELINFNLFEQIFY